MDKNLFVSKLNKAAPGAVLETRPFGRSSTHSIWVEAHSIEKVARVLREDPELSMDWLENLSVVELEEVLVSTYFVRSSTSRETLVLRISVVPTSPTEIVEMPSIRNIWPMGSFFEKEAEELFGVRFKLAPESQGSNGFQHLSDSALSAKLLPESWTGFPLRKSYVFPTEFQGIIHSRPFEGAGNSKKILT